MQWWHPAEMERKLPFLKARQSVIRSVRQFFDDQDFLEVETPALQVAPCMEAHIRAFSTELEPPHREELKRRYLHTSPEFAMKKLLVAGLPRIYQICHVFRNAEGSRQHSAEFSMIEWYRAHSGYRTIMEDTIALLRKVASDAGIAAYRSGGLACDPFVDWEILSVRDAVKLHAGIDIDPILDDPEALRRAVEGAGLHTAPEDRWDDLFFRVFLEKVEPRLGQSRPTILYDYPAGMAALARRKPEDPRYAERFEVYVCGVELANAFGELTDPVEQRARFEHEVALRRELYGDDYPVDEDFLSALEFGMPEAGGIALGIDRLAMLAAGAGDIDDILWCGRPS